MRANLRLIHKFSKLYDVITIGPYANRVAKLLAKSSPVKIQILTIEQNPYIMEPSLIPVINHSSNPDSKAGEKDKPFIKLNQMNHQFSDVEIGVGVHRINPDQSSLTLKNGNSYRYRHLVYSSDGQQWRQPPSTPSQSLSRQIYSDTAYDNIRQLFQKRAGRVIFTVPKGIHFGYENYFMMLLQERMEGNRKKIDCYGMEPVEIVVVCQGDGLAACHQGLNGVIDGLLAERGIKVIKNMGYTVNGSKKQLALTDGTVLLYSSLFQYQPATPPTLLLKSSINPFTLNRHTLTLQTHENIHILGNTLAHPYTPKSIHGMSQIIAKNLQYSLNGVRKRVLYDGYTGVDLWVGGLECCYVEIDYQGVRGEIGGNRGVRGLVAGDRKLLWRRNLYSMINYADLGFSWFRKPKVVSFAYQTLDQAIKKQYK